MNEQLTAPVFEPQPDPNMYPALYVPATMPPEKIAGLMNGSNPDMHRMVICTEDSVSEDNLEEAKANVAAATAMADPEGSVDAFVRVRNQDVMAELMDMPHINKLAGFVIPKAGPKTFEEYVSLMGDDAIDFKLLPIMESQKMTDYGYREDLLDVFREFRDNIGCLRVGGNDLMGYQGIRRDDHEFTIYDTVTGKLIADIVNEFRGLGEFTVTAPVFECYGPQYEQLFRKEVRQHILNQLFGQTVIHPVHLPILNDMYRVRQQDYESALGIVGSTQAVNGQNNKMDEKTTHQRWAEGILVRERQFGLQEPEPSSDSNPDVARSSAGAMVTGGLRRVLRAVRPHTA